jgi:branched-chain amino acid transport system permease protein
VTGVINFAQGDFVMLGALLFAILAETGWSLVPAAAVAVAVTLAVGVLVERLVLHPARGATTTRLIVLTIGASITIQGVALVVFGTDPHFAADFTSGAPLQLGPVVVLYQYLWVVGVTAVAVTALWWFLTRATLGKAMRASSMNARAARIVGISPSRMSLLAFSLAALLGAIAGVVLAPLQAPDAGIGLALGLKGFTAAVLGGLDSPSGAIVGGLTIGVVESMAAGWFPSGYQDAITFGLLFAAILLRPNGLLRPVREVRV